jgi:glycogen phosphorylase
MRNTAPEMFLGKVHFIPNLPEEISGLKELSRNLWWTWNPRARMLFRLIDLEIWISSKGNAVRFLRNISQAKLDQAAQDKTVLKRYKEVMTSFRNYIQADKSWWNRHYGEEEKDTLIVYFSAEFGLHEIFQIYSGGLGVLAGDHCKAASDLGIPMVAVGLLYREGYFQQRIDQNGKQEAHFEVQRWEDLPIDEVKDSDDNELKVQVEFPGRLVTAKVWCIHCGLIPLYVLDTDLTENLESDRLLTSRLYGGDQEMRIQQEILLGMGGCKALRALKKIGLLPHDPTTYHLNEGHAAFLSLERLKNYMEDDKLSVDEATEVIRASQLFTTHTPVPAGHDRFPLGMIDKYFRHYYEKLSFSRNDFLHFGTEPMPDGQQLFSMTILALRFSAMANGVSKLHGNISKKMMAPFWPGVPSAETPIGYITNGVHTRTWMSFDMQELFDKYMGPSWRERIMHQDMWEEAVDLIPDEELWATMCKQKADLVDFIHIRLRQQHERFGDLPDELEQLNKMFRSDALTFGFARRFATYKRATLIFHDPDRLSQIMNNPERPIQIVFAGKAHPADHPGQEFIRQIIEYSKSPQFLNRLVFLENYDMSVGRRMTSGVDVWLNNPLRPNEASGTSGMKVPLNGGLNCSILDGWWPEAYKMSENIGWAVGSGRVYKDRAKQDQEDAEHLYRLLETEIAPHYYLRNDKDIPTKWLEQVKEAMVVVGPNFTSDRQVTQYTENYYIKGSRRYTEVVAKQYAEARQYAKEKADLRANWNHIKVAAKIVSDMPVGTDMYSQPVKNEIKIQADVALGNLSPDKVIVEIYSEDLVKHLGGVPEVERFPMTLEKQEERGGQTIYLYKGSFTMNESGEHGFTVRVIPNDPKLFHPQELALVRWAVAE